LEEVEEVPQLIQIYIKTEILDLEIVTIEIIKKENQVLFQSLKVSEALAVGKIRNTTKKIKVIFSIL
jgi:hypothetical protein